MGVFLDTLFDDTDQSYRGYLVNTIGNVENNKDIKNYFCTESWHKAE
jgi:hypothetical protein